MYRVYEINANAYSDIHPPELPSDLENHLRFIVSHQQFPAGVQTVIRSQKILAVDGHTDVYLAQKANKNIAAVVISPTDFDHEYLTKVANARLMPVDCLDTELRSPLSRQYIGFTQPLCAEFVEDVESLCHHELPTQLTHIEWSHDHSNVFLEFEDAKVSVFRFGDLLRSISGITPIRFVNGMEYPVIHAP